MTRDEVTPDDHIRFAEIGRKIDPMIPAIADFPQDLEEGALVERFAVHDYAVHVEDERLIFSFSRFHGQARFMSLSEFHRPRLDGRNNGTRRYGEVDRAVP